MLSARHRLRRLVTIRIASPVLDAEIRGFDDDLRRAVAAVDGPLVFCTDMRGARILRHTTADRLVGLMRRNNLQLLRTGLVLPPEGATLCLQIERILREAGSPARKVFRDPHDAAVWLSAVLGPQERVAVTEFLAEQPAPVLAVA